MAGVLFESKLSNNNAESVNRFHENIPSVVQKLVGLINRNDRLRHRGHITIPSHEAIVQIIHQVRRILFPGYFNRSWRDVHNLEYCLGQEAIELFERLSKQIVLSIQHDCLRLDQPCSQCTERGYETALQFIQALPEIRAILATDIQAALEGDPAAKSYDEVIFSYPGLFAITVYRMAHKLNELDVPLLPRGMTEYAHSLTGIDIHPGAEIGESFFIDHGTGVVVGETTEIGNRVRVYQGVTLGALSLPRDAATRFRNKKRHPTIEDDVIIYSNATILGGDTVIGARSIIGGNVWITESVPPETKVLLKRPELVYYGSSST
nr:serine acetyltransferase [Desulfobacterales bacterium]